jgi:hypothetical protein
VFPILNKESKNNPGMALYVGHWPRFTTLHVYRSRGRYLTVTGHRYVDLRYFRMDPHGSSNKYFNPWLHEMLAARGREKNWTHASHDE